jgi:hypothetical protein
MKCRSVEARELARRLIAGETITREMASSEQVWALVRNSAMGVAASAHAKLIKNGVSAEKRRAWLRRQQERVEATFGNAKALEAGQGKPRVQAAPVVVTLAKARAQAMKDPASAEAMRDATDIRQWTDGPKPEPWRVYRLARALIDDRRDIAIQVLGELEADGPPWDTGT